MSFRLVDAAFIIKLPSSEKAVLFALCRHANDDGSDSYASVPMLAGEAGVSVSTAQRAIRALESRRYIVAESGKEGGRHHQTVQYRILIPNAEVVAAIKSLYGSHGDTRTGSTVTPVDDGSQGDTHGSHSDTPTGSTVTPTGSTVTDESVLESVRRESVRGIGHPSARPFSSKTEEQGKKPYEYGQEESEEIAAIFGKKYA